MMFLYDGLIFYILFGKELLKIEEVCRNLYVFVLIGYESLGFVFLEINGLVFFEEDELIKECIWENIFKEWF